MSKNSKFDKIILQEYKGIISFRKLMKNLFKLPIIKRKLVAIPLGIVFGFLCAYLAWQADPTTCFWQSPLTWQIVYNRMLIGAFILIMGVFTVHPVLKFRLFPAFRGALIGAVVSIDLGLGIFITPIQNDVSIFWMTIGFGAFYGFVIDVIATKIAGEGKKLLETM